jgi:hypothetical protein
VKVLRRAAGAVFSAAPPSMAVIQAVYQHVSRIEIEIELDRAIWGLPVAQDATNELIGLAAFG